MSPTLLEEGNGAKPANLNLTKQNWKRYKRAHFKGHRISLNCNIKISQQCPSAEFQRQLFAACIRRVKLQDRTEKEMVWNPFSTLNMMLYPAALFCPSIFPGCSFRLRRKISVYQSPKLNLSHRRKEHIYKKAKLLKICPIFQEILVKRHSCTNFLSTAGQNLDLR